MSEDSIFFDIILYISYVGIIGAGAGAVLLPLILGLKEEPKRLLGVVAGIVLLGVLFLIGYSISGSEAPAIYEKFGVGAGLSKFIGGFLNMFYELAFIIFAVILGSFVISLINNPSNLLRTFIAVGVLVVAFFGSYSMSSTLSTDSEAMASYPYKTVTQVDNSVTVYDTYETWVTQEAGVSESLYRWIGGAFNLTTLFIILAAALPILFSLVRPLSLIRPVAVGAAVGLILLIGYSVADAEQTATTVKFGIQEGTNKFIGGVLILSYLLLGLAFVLWIASGVKRMITNLS